ncbi:MAG: radical SAM family heme chaperone HemW [Nitrospira sp.]|nr:radical SAM family heme chaperone HemW [Nitrospira sp.]
MIPSEAIGLYIHVPFCRRRCHFCAFYLEIAQPNRIAQFQSALLQEIALHAQHDVLNGRLLESIYFGGGTPTSLPTEYLTTLLKRIRATWPTGPSAEITLEAHPSTVSFDDLRALAQAGFNRISFGAESMKDQDFASIGRFGLVRDTATAVQESRRAGFQNINLDLMYGLPGQSVQDWMHTVESLLMLQPTHISCYALTVEENTRLAQDIAQQIVVPPDDALQNEMESVTEDILASAGFTHYEISNYAKPGYSSRHNLLYWTGGEYLGLGPSAQSYLAGTRFGNIANLASYVETLSRDRLPIVDQTTLSPSERQRDALVFGLRLLRGVPRVTSRTADRDLQVDTLLNQGLLASDHDRLWLTPLGRRYADTVEGALF